MILKTSSTDLRVPHASQPRTRSIRRFGTARRINDLSSATLTKTDRGALGRSDRERRQSAFLRSISMTLMGWFVLILAGPATAALTCPQISESSATSASEHSRWNGVVRVGATPLQQAAVRIRRLEPEPDPRAFWGSITNIVDNVLRIMSPNGGLSIATTDASGRFEFRGVEPGRYRFEVLETSFADYSPFEDSPFSEAFPPVRPAPGFRMHPSVRSIDGPILRLPSPPVEIEMPFALFLFDLDDDPRSNVVHDVRITDATASTYFVGMRPRADRAQERGVWVAPDGDYRIEMSRADRENVTIVARSPSRGMTRTLSRHEAPESPRGHHRLPIRISVNGEFADRVRAVDAILEPLHSEPKSRSFSAIRPQQSTSLPISGERNHFRVEFPWRPVGRCRLHLRIRDDGRSFLSRLPGAKFFPLVDRVREIELPEAGPLSIEITPVEAGVLDAACIDADGLPLKAEIDLVDELLGIVRSEPPLLWREPIDEADFEFGGLRSDFDPPVVFLSECSGWSAPPGKWRLVARSIGRGETTIPVEIRRGETCRVQVVLGGR